MIARSLPEWGEDVRQAVVIDFLHQGQQAANFTRRESFAREPVEVIARQVRNDSALVHAKWHLPGDEQFQVLWTHVINCLGIE